MDKLIMVDGNNLLFRSYYATAYQGNFMKNSKGFPTNALFGFTNMINKIIKEEKPTNIIVAFDKGKTFRHEKYDFYKGGRDEMPNELALQFPVAKKMLNLMGIKYYEIDNYEADDIIGTFASICDINNYHGLIISSDKDLLQLISKNVEVKLLKSSDYIRYDLKSFKNDYGIDPINIIDLKALMGDSSDNIPGVKGIGEKTALKLLHEFKTLDGIYNNLDKIKGAVLKKLENDKKSAYMSYEIATIYRLVPLTIDINDTIYNDKKEELYDLYRDLEFYSFLKDKKIEESDIDYVVVSDINDFVVKGDAAYFLSLDNANYHKANILGMGVYSKDKSYFVPYDILKQNPSFLTNNIKYTYDLKKNIVCLKWHNINLDNTQIDIMLAAYLLEYNVKENISYLARELSYEIDSTNIEKDSVLKAKFIYEIKDRLIDELHKEKMLDLFNHIEMPLSLVLADMEYTGFNVSKEMLDNMGLEIKEKIDNLRKEIYDLSGEEFNISSPSQLGIILFDKLSLPHGKKTKTGYSTSSDILEKLKYKHPVIDKIIEYRMLMKLYSSYIEGLKNNIFPDNKIHTIYTQTITRTGRLSSIEPNLQNIPIRNEYGRLIRKAFLPSEDSIILSSDYSQIELRLLSHMADIKTLKEAFNKNLDIHKKTASDIFKVDINSVTKEQRRMAKAVNFGIIYGISSFGLSENLNIKVNDAKEFIDNYYETYPGIKEYMDNIVKYAKEDCYVKTLFGRKRTVKEINNKNYLIRQAAYRICLNTPIQGTAADIIKKAMIDVYNEFNRQKLKSKILVQVHDELVIDLRNDEKDKVIKILTDKMENVYKLSVPLKVDISYGKDWYSAK